MNRVARALILFAKVVALKCDYGFVLYSPTFPDGRLGLM